MNRKKNRAIRHTEQCSIFNYWPICLLNINSKSQVSTSLHFHIFVPILINSSNTCVIDTHLGFRGLYSRRPRNASATSMVASKDGHSRRPVAHRPPWCWLLEMVTWWVHQSSLRIIRNLFWTFCQAYMERSYNHNFF